MHPHKDMYHMIQDMPSSQLGYIHEATRQVLGQPHSPMYHKFSVTKPVVHESHYHEILRSSHKSGLAHRIAAEPLQGSGLKQAVSHVMNIAAIERHRDREIPFPTILEKMPMEM